MACRSLLGEFSDCSWSYPFDDASMSDHGVSPYRGLGHGEDLLNKAVHRLESYS